MSAIAATDVTYSIVKNKKLEDGRKILQASITFGNGSLTYPSGGVPLTIGKLGCPVAIDSIAIDDKGSSGYQFSFDKANNKIRMFQAAAHSHSLSLKNAAVADGATTRVNAGTNLLGANTGSDITVAGGGANGGVAAIAAAALAELGTSVAPAALTIKVTVIGY